MHSMPVAEPIGVVIGIIAGRVGANFGKKLAIRWALPTFLGAMVGSMISHYIASVLTKAVINGAVIDLVGGTANVAVTSPATSVLHGAFEAITEVLPGLDFEEFFEEFASFFGEELTQAQPDINQLFEAASAGTGSVLTGVNDTVAESVQNEVASASGQVQFGRSLQPLEQMADCQGNLPTCGVEGGIENPIQAAYPWVGNDISDNIIKLIPQAIETGLPLDTYQSLLWQNGIQSQWSVPDPSIMFNAVTQPGCGVVIHGDPHFLNPEVFPTPGSYHTVFLSEPWYDSNGNPLGYIGIDSAPQSSDKRIVHWTFEQVQKMIQGSPLNPFKGRVLLTIPSYKV